MASTQIVIIGTALLKAAVTLYCTIKLVACAYKAIHTWQDSLVFKKVS